MKLFLYDNKHVNIIAKLNLGELGQEGINVVNKILDFLDNNNVTDRYKSLTLVSCEIIGRAYVEHVYKPADAKSGLEIKFEKK